MEDHWGISIREWASEIEPEMHIFQLQDELPILGCHQEIASLLVRIFFLGHHFNIVARDDAEQHRFYPKLSKRKDLFESAATICEVPEAEVVEGVLQQTNNMV